jgi:hypothetical protein
MKRIIALTFAASSLFLAGCCSTHHVTQWEYRQVSTIEAVNKAAADGWVVAGFSTHISSSTVDGSGTTNYGNSDRFLLKRPKK